MSRHISIFSRRANVIDLLLEKTPGAFQYRLKWASNFDSATWTTFITSQNTGFVDTSVDDSSNVIVYGDRVRVRFDPHTYNITDGVFWIVLSPLDFNGNEMFTTPPLMVMGPNLDGSYFPQYTISGSAPSAVSLAGSLQIQFPRQIRDLRIQNAAAMWVAFDENGPEILLAGDTLPKVLNRWSTQSSLFVRSSGAAVPFSLLFTIAYTK